MAIDADIAVHDFLEQQGFRRDEVFDGPPREAIEKIVGKYLRKELDGQIERYFTVPGNVVAESFPDEDLKGKYVVYVVDSKNL